MKQKGQYDEVKKADEAATFSRRDAVKRIGLMGSALALSGTAMASQVSREESPAPAEAELILHNGRITTLNPQQREASAIAIAGGKVMAVGDDASILALGGSATRHIDLRGRRVIPGLNDSHTHLIRGGLNYNMELRWENVPTVADALELLRAQAARTPAPQWVRVVGGWSEFQFKERRMPTLEEVNRAAPETPVFILHLYSRALLNRAALRALGMDQNTPDPPGGTIVRDDRGQPTGLLVASPSALILYSTLSRAPKLDLQDQLNSTRHFMRELNRLGITSVIDAGGGGQNFPQDYQVIQQLHDAGDLTVRIAYNLFAQQAGEELADYQRWTGSVTPGDGDAWLRMNGAGENLTWSAADFENFLQPRPDLAPIMEKELEPIVELLAEKRWPFRIHATYDETIDRFLGVFERVNGKSPFQTRFIIDHAETITPRNIERIKALGGGIAVQHRMAFQGEYFVQRYGAEAARATPPTRQMLTTELPVGAGTDATRVSSYDPWVALYWLTTGRTLGGMALHGQDQVLDRETALGLWTHGSAWFSGEQQHKGRLMPGQYADLAVLSADYFNVDDEAIKALYAVLTVVGGRIVHAADDYGALAPPLPPASPDWSPSRHLPSPGARPDYAAVASAACHDGCRHHCGIHGHEHHIAWNQPLPVSDRADFWGALGCSCFAI
ncbi:MAG: amidohydrolase [Wenzhouxiangellaceae bacterium]